MNKILPTRNHARLLYILDKHYNADGGKGSGNWGHKGRPGEVGGSGEGGSSEEKRNVANEAHGKKIQTLQYYDRTVQYGRDSLESYLNDLKEGFGEKYSKPIDDFISNSKKYMSQVRNAVDRFDFSSYTDAKSVLSILIDGRMKTYQETGVTHGSDVDWMRENATRELYGLHDDETWDNIEIKPEEYEHYGCLDSAPRGENYGDCRIVLKKENVRDRTTLTIGDSLEAYSGGRDPVPTSVNDPDVISIGTNYIFDNNAPSTWDAQNSFYEKCFNSAESNGFIDCGDYIELQFHGEITLEDIEEIHVSESNPMYGALKRMCEIKGVKIVSGGV